LTLPGYDYAQAHWSHSVSHLQWIFQTCGSIATDSCWFPCCFSRRIKLRAFPLYQQSLSRCITCQDVCVQQSYAAKRLLPLGVTW